MQGGSDWAICNLLSNGRQFVQGGVAAMNVQAL